MTIFPGEIHVFLGFVGGVLVTVALFPQLFKLYRTHSAKDLSSLTYILYAIGVSFWFLYGISGGDLILSIFKFIGVIISLVILFGIWKFQKK